jgi:endogenous inhibitor of DNA gyrase (YacG/DUF329 family)
MAKSKIKIEKNNVKRVCWTCDKTIPKDSNYPFCNNLCKVKWEYKQPDSNTVTCLNCRESFYKSSLSDVLCSRKCKMEYYKAEIN